MRIECERCHAAFSVDDARIPPAGARAACPRCGAQVVLRPSQPDAPPTPAPAIGPGLDPFAELAAPGPDAMPFELLPPTAEAPAPVPPDPLAPGLGLEVPAPRKSQPLPPDPLERDGVDTGEFALPASPDPPSLAHVTGQQPLPADPLERDGHTTGQFAVPDAATAAMSSAAGRITGQYPVPKLPDQTRVTAERAMAPPSSTTAERTPIGAPFDPEALFESFDAATTAGHRTGEVTAALGRLAAEGTQWRVKKQEGLVEGPFNAAELTARWDAGLIQPTDLVAKDTGPFQGLSAHPLTAGFLGGRAGRRVKAFASSQRGPLPWRSILAVLALVLGGVLGAAVFSARPAFFFGPKRPPADTSALAIIDSWRRKEGPISASEHDLYQLARGYQAADTPGGFQRAAEAYERVLIKDPKNLDAMARFAEVRAIGALDEGDEVGGREAAELLAFALRHGQNLAEPHVARAELLLRTGTAGDLLVAQNEAELALQLAPNSPSVQLAWARAFIDTNADLALKAAEKVERVAPKERGVLLVKGAALLKLGRIAEARAAFEQREKLVPEDPTAALKLAELDVSIGRFHRARARLGAAEKSSPKSIDLQLLHAMLAYQIDGDLPAARKELAGLLAQPLDPRHKLRVLVHAAAVAEELRQLPEAEAFVRAGQAIDPDSAPLAFRLALVYLDQGKPEEAKKLVDKVKNELPDATRRALLEGRIDAALGQVDLAQAEFQRATVLTPLRIDGYLLGASLYAQVGAAEQALALAHRALQADPEWARTHRRLTQFHERRAGPQDGTVGGLQTLALAGDDEGLTLAAVAMARYHAGDFPGAEKAAKQALATGEGALAAHAYLAQLALDRHDPMQALEESRAALDADRSSALASYLNGRALAQLQRWEEAHAKYRDALGEDPNFLPALVHDAQAVAELGRPDDALKLLQKAYRYDPDDLDTRRELDALEDHEAPPSLDDYPTATAGQALVPARP